jgi:hypothetical protein
MKIFLFLFLISGNLLATESQVCAKTKAEWMKCAGDLPKDKAGAKLKIHSKPPAKDACYSWVGEAEFICQNGYWTLEKKGQTCNWDCICCY